MDFPAYYRERPTYITHVDDRLEKIIRIVVQLAPGSLLDIGCGNGFLLEQLLGVDSLRETAFSAIDVYTSLKMPKVNYVTGDVTKGLPYRSGEFDCAILGEVIEHVPNPDFVLREIHRALKINGYLVISTPNLVSWANRILVVLGIQPLYTETSSEVKLGRYFKFLGQGNTTEGHLKIFTAQSLGEILEHTHFEVLKKVGVPFFFPQPIAILDRLLTHWVPLASGLLYVAKKSPLG